MHAVRAAERVDHENSNESTLCGKHPEEPEHRDDEAEASSPTLKETLEQLRNNRNDIRELDLTNMSLASNRLEENGGVLVARVLALNHTVERLILPDHGIGDRGAKAIADMLRVNHTVRYLDLYGNSITDEGLMAIAQAIYGHESIEALHLWSNEITDVGATALAQALPFNRTITYVGLVDNQIGEQGALALIEAVEKNPILQTINLAQNDVPAETLHRLNSALATNKLLCMKILPSDDDEQQINDDTVSSDKIGTLDPSIRQSERTLTRGDSIVSSDGSSASEEEDESVWI